MVTISLMVLLSLLAVGMLSLSTIAIRGAGRDDAMARAKANARLALLIALGELQKEMGPDSRISAPYDSGGDSESGEPHWTGVYDAWRADRDLSNARETPGARNPEFRTWLVSGSNQDSVGSERIELLGNGSLGDSADPDDMVEVPAQTVRSGNSGGTFAWWVADEGIKAKVNAGTDPDSNPSGESTLALLRSQSPPTIGHRAISGLDEFEWNDNEREITTSLSQLGLAADLPARSLGRSFHDVTLHSAGVLADVRAGRLKRDLSNLLSRPASEVEDKPLYLADGRMNWLSIGEDGAVSNASGIPTSWTSGYNSGSQWGINFEELQLFHGLHREVAWDGGRPSLRMKNSREQVVRDRYYIYRRPSVQALQFIFSMEAVPDQTAGRYKMQMKMDAMVSLSNPNDIPITCPPGLILPFQLLNLPYDLKWDIRRTSGAVASSATTNPGNFNVFMGHIEGGTAGLPATGFTLEPGEAATFGSSTANGYTLNLRRGFVPSGGVTLSNWDLKARDLMSTDRVDFDFNRITRTARSNAWTYYNAWFGPRNSSSGWQMDSAALFGGSLEDPLMNNYLPATIEPPQVRPVSDFIGRPQPVLMISFMQNVEQSSGNNPPDAFASRPHQFNEPSLCERSINPDNMLGSRHDIQMVVTAESMNFQFRTLAAGAGGRNIYIGGGRQPNLGGTFNVISRRIPLSPPLSIGAFKNAIASGFCDHFSEMSERRQIGANALAIGKDPFPSNAEALTGHVNALPLVAQAIGNSYSIPHLSSDEVFSASANTTAIRGSQGNVASDHSWMVNTALWDSWFLSGIVDGSGSGSSPWLADNRTPRQQFEDFAKGERPLRNERYLFHSSESPDEVIDDLFTGSNLKNSAINRLPAYLMVDGCFNVNSTSAAAWTALLSSIHEQSLISRDGSVETLDHPLGTLGYAASTANTGPDADWNGFRDLNNDDIEKLAEAIVDEVRARGPFLSMADFVNRRPSSEDPEHRAVGALQSAIDRSGLNDRFTGAGRDIGTDDFATAAPDVGIDDEPAPARAVGAAGHLSQADLLTVIGSQISVRSDTFVIRTYGDARDSSGQIEARAWCEAVVQRVPDYIDPSDAPEAENGWPKSSDSLEPVNLRFGRRFVIQSFRWMTQGEV